MVALFPNWIVKHIRRPNLHTAAWLRRPVEVFLVSPKMSKLEIKEYLRKLYQLPVTAVHTANYIQRKAINAKTMRKTKVNMYIRPVSRAACAAVRRVVLFLQVGPDYKKAYVYLRDENGSQRPRYSRIEEQLTSEAQEAWPAKPGHTADTIARKN